MEIKELTETICTISQFNKTILPILQFAVSVLGLGAIALLWWQIKDFSKWNKLKSPFSFVSSEEDIAETETLTKSKAIGIELKLRRIPLTNEEVNKIIENDDAYNAIMRFLTFAENNSLAINAGIVDKKMAHASHASRIREIYKLYAPFIQELRRRYDDDLLYIELEQVALEASKVKEEKDLEKKQQIKKIYAVPKIA